MLSTETLGGVAPTPEEQRDMQAGDYILHARDGKIEKVAVEKVRMPLDPKGHYQGLALLQAPSGAIYAVQRSIWSKSTDGGRTWEHLERDATEHGFGDWRCQFNSDGQLINVGENATDIWASDDEGQTWSKFGQIDAAVPFKEARIGDNILRLGDGTLMVTVKHMEKPFYEGENPAYTFRSTDGGRTFPQRSFLSNYGCEINISELSPGRLMAVIRHQPGPPDKPETNKTVFLADSTDSGVTWSTPRQLTTVNGQAHGAAVGLSGHRVVVAHDHRYPRSMGACRAMISHDDGQTWEDEVYYLCHGNSAGYPRHLTLDSQEILTFVGSCYGDVEAGWDTATGNSNLCLIRWRPV